MEYTTSKENFEMLEIDNNITTNRTLNNIRKVLKTTLKNKYNIEDEDKIEKILEIHGLTKNRFDFIKSIENTIVNQLNDISIDANSNKNEKTVEGIIQEAINPAKKAIGYDFLYRQMKELYGKPEAKRLTGELYDFSLGLSDSTNILKPYCWSLDASKLVTIGREFGQLHSKPCKRISSYISALSESIHQLSSHLAGAIAVGSFFFDIAHLSLYSEKIDLRELKTNTTYRKRLENEFQQFVHSVNHLSRSGVESPFTNISIFDSIKLRTLLKDMKWYFINEDLPIVHPIFENDDEREEFYTKYIIDYIIEIQNIYLDFFDKGDPAKGGMPYRFPVQTLNISKKKWGDKEIIEDTEFLKSVCKREIFRYNIFTSEGTKVASCCRLVNNAELMNMASQVNSFGGGGSISMGSHRVVTINFNRIALESSTLDQYYNILGNRLEDATKVLKAHKELIKNLTKKGLQMFISNGWINMNRMFSTVGLLGIYEAAIMLSSKFGKNDYYKDILIFVDNKIKDLATKYGLVMNSEQIPAESYAIRLCETDKLLYGEELVPYKLYANQFVPLWEDATVWEKMDVDGRLNKLITGGGIVHISINEKVTPKQAEKLIKYAVNSGCEHFALNSVWSQCENNHASFGKNEICPECGGKVVDYMTRIVGFMTPVSSWTKVRREWEFPNRKFTKMPQE